jgi:hypothetical protein
MAICPICFSDLGTPSYADFQWTDDPIFTTPTLSTAQYVGFTRMKAQHIKELQQNRNQLETNLGLTLTVFTPMDVSNLFQNWDKYILELRQSTEALLTAVGMTKETYFNYDKNGTDMNPGNHQLDWIDVVDLTNHNLCHFQSKGRHIEDLRHFIQTIWQETWSDFSFSDSCNIDGEGTSEELKTGILNADHDWDYNLSWTENALKAIGSSVAGLNYFKSDAILVCNNNYAFNGYSEAVPLGFASQGTATSFHGIVHTTNQTIIPATNPNLNLIINNLNYSYTRNATGTGGDLPKIPTLIIRISMGGDIYYVFGDENYYPLTYKILISSSNYSGNLQRNLYNDFFTLYGVYPSSKVSQIRIYTRTDSVCASSAFFETPRWGQNASVSVSLETIQLRNIA